MFKGVLLLALTVFLIVSFSCRQGVDSTSNYIAKVGDSKITQEDVIYAIATNPKLAAMQSAGQEGINSIVNELINREVLYLEAQKRGIDQDKEVKKKLEEAKRFIMVSHLVAKEIDPVSRVDEKDAKEYYEKNKDNFVQDRQVRFSKIVVKTPEEMKKVTDRLQAGEDFAKVAREMSIDTKSAQVGGDMGFINPIAKVKYTPELEQIVYTLKKGELSQPFNLAEGITIVKVTEIKGKQIPFDLAKDQAIRILQAERQKAVFDKLMASVKKTIPIEIKKDEVAKLVPSIPVGKSMPKGHP